MTARPWTEAETEILKARFYAGVGMRAIGKELGRSYCSAENKLRAEIAHGNIVDRQNMAWRAKQLLTAGYSPEYVAHWIECPLPIVMSAMIDEARGVV